MALSIQRNLRGGFEANYGLITSYQVDLVGHTILGRLSWYKNAEYSVSNPEDYADTSAIRIGEYSPTLGVDPCDELYAAAKLLPEFEGAVDA